MLGFALRHYWVAKGPLFAVLFSMLALGGCGTVWLDPYIDSPKRDLSSSYDTNSTGLPTLLNAAQEVQAQRQTATSYRSQMATGQSLLKYTVFGAAAAGGISALYGAHSDLVLGFGLGAVSAYGAGSLFASGDQASVYGAAGDALGCLVGQADIALAADKTLKAWTQPSGGFDARKTKLQKLLGKYNTWPQGLKDNANAAISNYETAITNISIFRAADSTFAATLRKTESQITETTNRRIKNLQASIEDVLAIARGIGVGGVNYLAEVTPAPADGGALPGGAAAVGPQPTPQEEDDLKSLSQEVAFAAASINDKVAAATNSIDEVSSLCLLKEGGVVAALAVNPSKISIIKDQDVALAISGGKPPFKVSWYGVTPKPKEVSHNYDPLSGSRIINLSGKSEITAGTYQLQVEDSQAAPQRVIVTVTATN